MNGENKQSEKSPSRKDLYTGQKKRYFTVFYNFALKKLLRVINDIDKQYQRQKGNSEITEGHLFKLTENPALISDKCYALLKDYCWKAFTDAKNTSGMALTGDDKRLIAKLFYYLVQVRNYHSHYYHSNEALQVGSGTASFIENLYEKAKLAFAETNMQELNMLEADMNELEKDFRMFSEHNGNFYFTPEGRVFFLSLFLNKAEMNRCLDDVQKDKNGKIFKHKILRKIFTAYCHRGGVERFKYNQDETVFTNLDPSVQKSIMHLRQVYKIVNYLNNVPLETANADDFPLFFEIKNENGKEKIQGRPGNANEYISLSGKLGLFTDYNLKAVNKKEEKETNAKSGVNAKVRKTYFAFGNIYNIEVIELTKDGHTIEFKLQDFHKVVLSCIKQNLFLQNITKVLDAYLEGKKAFLDFFKTLDFEKGMAFGAEDEQLFIKQWNSFSYFWKGIDNKLRVKLEEKKQQYIKRVAVRKDHKNELVEKIKQHCIKLRFIDLFHEEQQMVRKENLFTKFAVQYILDHNLLPNWHWQHHRYEIAKEEKDGKECYINKKRLSYHNTPQQQTVSVDDNGHAIAIYSENAEIETPKKQQLFVIGTAAMRNIMLYLLFKKNNKNPDAFLKQLLQEWNDKKNPANQLVVDKFMPSHTKGMAVYKSAVIENARKKIAKLNERLNGYLQLIKEEKFNKSRNDKNALIMYLYRLYDGWQAETKNGKEVKFLRKNQYQLLSVYHYYLQKTPLDNLVESFLYMIPDRVKSILKKANSIDDLLQKLLIDVVTNVLPALKNALQPSMSDDKLKSICQKMQVKKHLLNKSETENHKHLPYDIHPLQIMMYMENKTAPELEKQSLVQHTIKSRLDQLTNGLKTRHYEILGYVNFIQQYAPELIKDDDKLIKSYIKSLTRKVTGAANAVLVQDVIIWQMAQEYMKANKEYFNKHNISIPQVTNLRRAVILLPVELDNTKYNIELYYHQLDDLLFIETKKYLAALTSYHLRYRAFMKKPISDQIAFTALQEEYTRLVNDSLLFSDYLMLWEKKEFEKLAIADLDKLERIERGLPRISFKEYCERRAKGYKEFDKLSKEEKAERKQELIGHLYEMEKELRNKALHAEIPGSYVYPQRTEEEFIKNELVTPFELEAENKKKAQKEKRGLRSGNFKKQKK